MVSDQSDEHMAERLKQLEQLTGGLVGRSNGTDDIPVNAAPLGLVPVPSRSRVFLRNGKGHGEGHGAFANLTVTAPIARTSPA